MKLLSFDQQCNETSIANGSENFELRELVWIVFLLFGSFSSMGFCSLFTTVGQWLQVMEWNHGSASFSTSTLIA
jgi:hypothetical protein